MSYFLAVNELKENAAVGALGPAIREHVDWTMKMIRQGVCLQAGRWGERGGMAIFKAENREDAQRLLNDDPLVRAGLVTFSLERFYPDVPFGNG